MLEGLVYVARVKYRWCTLCASERVTIGPCKLKRDVEARVRTMRRNLREQFGPIHGRILEVNYERGELADDA